MGTTAHAQSASGRFFAALSIVLVYMLAAVPLASAESKAANGLTSSTFMANFGSSPTLYESRGPQSSTVYSDDNNYTYSAGFNASPASGWHEVDYDSCSFAAGTTYSCTIPRIQAGSSQDGSSEQRVSTRHQYWWNWGSADIYTSGRRQGTINNTDGRYSSYNCVYNPVCWP